MTEKLLPCPFCGEKADIEYLVTGKQYYAVCQNTNCRSSSANWSNEKRAMKQWNARTQSPESKHKCQICAKESVVNQNMNGWRCQDHVLFGQSPESSGLVSPQGVPCIHEWAWSNNSGRYYCNKCQHWSYLGKEEVGTQQSKLVPLADAIEISNQMKGWAKIPSLNLTSSSVRLINTWADCIAKFGSPSVPSVEDIEREFLYNPLLQNNTPYTSLDKAQAIHRLLTNGKEGKEGKGNENKSIGIGMGIGHCHAITQQGEVKIGLNRDKLIEICKKNWDNHDGWVVIAKQKNLFEVKK